LQPRRKESDNQLNVFEQKIKSGRTRSGLWVHKKEQFVEFSYLKTTSRDYFNKKKQLAMALGKYVEVDDIMDPSEARALANRHRTE